MRTENLARCIRGKRVSSMIGGKRPMKFTGKEPVIGEAATKNPPFSRPTALSGFLKVPVKLNFHRVAF